MSIARNFKAEEEYKRGFQLGQRNSDNYYRKIIADLEFFNFVKNWVITFLVLTLLMRYL